MQTTEKITIIGISGSLKSTSFNTHMLRALAAMAPEGVALQIFTGLDTLPHFNPEITEIPATVRHWRQQIQAAQGVVISTPEYAFGIPGVLKNALDWLVSTGEINAKPTIAISASPLPSGGDKALASLLWTLTALGTRMDERSARSIPTIKKKMDENGLLHDPETNVLLKALLDHLLEIIHTDLNATAP